MDTYSLLREFADSWFLIAMFGFFLACVARAFWPTATMRAAQSQAANIPLTDEPKTCDGTCEACKATRFEVPND